MSGLGMGEHAPWGNFPKFIRNGDLGALKIQPILGSKVRRPRSHVEHRRLFIDRESG